MSLLMLLMLLPPPLLVVLLLQGPGRPAPLRAVKKPRRDAPRAKDDLREANGPAAEKGHERMSKGAFSLCVCARVWKRGNRSEDLSPFIHCRRGIVAGRTPSVPGPL